MLTVALTFVICTTGLHARCADIAGGAYAAPALCARAGWPQLGRHRDENTLVIAFECSLVQPSAKGEHRG